MKFSKLCSPDIILKSFPELSIEAIGDKSAALIYFSEIDGEATESLGFINSPKYLEKAISSPISTWIVPAGLKDKILEQNPAGKNWILSPNPELLAREVKNQFALPTPFRQSWEGVHPTALIASTVELSDNVCIGPFVVIGENCKIGNNTFIGASTVIENDVTIGENSTIHPMVYVGHSCVIGNHCEIMPQAIIGSEGFGYAHDHKGNHYRIPHSGRVVLEDDVHVGAATAIDRGTLADSVIGFGTKIDNQVHLAHNTKVGRNGLLTAQAVTAGSSEIGDNFICGGKTAITGHIKITDNVNVAGLSGITKSVDKPGQYGGYPLLPLKDHLKVKVSAHHLPEMRKQLNKLMKHVFGSQN